MAIPTENVHVPVQSGPSSKEPAERRRATRFPVSASTEVLETKSGVRIKGRTTDLAIGGCYVDCITPSPVGTAVNVKMERGGETFEFQGSVVYSKVGMDMGVKFDFRQPNQLLEKWIRELSGEIPSEPEGLEESAGLPVASSASVHEEQFLVLTELVIALMRKKVLSAAEGKSLLSKLHRDSPG